MYKIILCVLIIAALGGTGCAVKVQDDYGQYLQNNAGQVSFPRIDRPFGYSVSPATEQHSAIVRSWMAGFANTWEVRFNDILQTTLNSADVRKAISMHPALAVDTDKILFDLISYKFEDTKATIHLRVQTALDNGATMSKVYPGEGQAQRGKMFWGGAFAMKNAVQQSSKMAMDQIFSAYFADLAEAVK